MNIDDILKNSFRDFEASPPESSWTQIQQHIPQPTGPVNTGTASAVKTTGIITKSVLITISSAVIAGGSYMYYRNLNNNQVIQNNISVPVNIPVTASPANQETPETTNAHPVEDQVKVQSTQQNKNHSIGKSENTIEITVTPDPVNTLSSIPAEPGQVVSLNPSMTSTNSSTPALIKSEKPKPRHDFNMDKTSIANSNSDEANPERPFIPNVITPDNDGKNDKLEIVINNETYFDLKILDRTGKLVFSSSSKEKTWDGSDLNTGELCPEGQYHYEFNYSINGTVKVYTLKGKIQIIR